MKLRDFPEHAKEAHTSIAKRAKMSLDEFMGHFGDWDCEPVNVHGKPVGAILSSGPVMHACISGQYGHWGKKHMLKMFHDRIDQHGFVRTSVAEGNRIGEAFVRRLGFEEVGRAQGIIQSEVRHGH